MSKALITKAFRANEVSTPLVQGKSWNGNKYFAIKSNVLKDYKLRSKEIITHQHDAIYKPVFDVLPNKTDCIDVQLVTDNSNNIDNTVEVSNKIKTVYKTVINENYHKLITKTFPDCEIYFGGKDNFYTPVQYYSNDELVAIVMPVKS